MSTKSDDYTAADTWSYVIPETETDPTPNSRHRGESYGLLNNCFANDKFDTTGKLKFRKPGMFLVFIYNKNP